MNPIILKEGEMCRKRKFCEFSDNCPGADPSNRNEKFICDIEELEKVQNKMRINNQEFEIIRKDVSPQVLIVTPLLPNHSISKETKKTLKRNDVKIVWVSSKGIYNTAMNAQLGFDWYMETYSYDKPKYFIKIDNDVVLGRYMLDRLVETLQNKPDNVGYSYCSFKFEGHVNVGFKADPFDIKRLLQHNYISSNSLFRSSVVEKVGMVTDDNMKRLLDWAFLLKLYYYGYIGTPCPTASFVAHSHKKDISANDANDYNIKRTRVLEKYGRIIMEKIKKENGKT